MVPGFHPPWIGPSMAFFFFPFSPFSPLLFNIVQSERGKGRGLARGHTFLLTQVFFQQAGGPAGDKDGAAPWAVCWLQALPLPPRCPAWDGHAALAQCSTQAPSRRDNGQQCPSPHPGTAQTSLTTASPGRKSVGFATAIAFPPSPADRAFPWLPPAGFCLATLLSSGMGRRPHLQTGPGCFGSRLSYSITLKLLEHSAHCQESQGGSRGLMAAPERTKHPCSSSTLSPTSFRT